jgi:putative FmdB family regulatory protein
MVVMFKPYRNRAAANKKEPVTMPIYEYVCEGCERRFQAMRSMSDRLAPLSCEACGSERTALAFSVPSRVGAASQAAPSGCARGVPGCAGGGCVA